MTIAVDYELTLKEAERALRDARSADDVRNTWKRHYAVLGHRALGRLLLGQPAASLIARREKE
jgi:hypothetical protein